MDKDGFRSLVLQDLGVEVDDGLEAVVGEAHRLEGVQQGAVQASKVVESVMLGVNREIEAERLSLEQAELIKQWLCKVSIAVEGVRVKAQTDYFIQQGRRDALKKVVGMIKKRLDTAQQKATTREQFPVPIKQQRLEEAQRGTDT